MKRGPRPIGHHRTHRGGAHGVPWVRVPRQCPGRGGRRPHPAHAPDGFGLPSAHRLRCGIAFMHQHLAFSGGGKFCKMLYFFKRGARLRLAGCRPNPWAKTEARIHGRRITHQRPDADGKQTTPQLLMPLQVLNFK